MFHQEWGYKPANILKKKEYFDACFSEPKYFNTSRLCNWTRKIVILNFVYLSS